MREGIAWLTAFVFSLYTDIFELQDFEPITHLCLSFPLHKKRITTTDPKKRLMTYKGFLPHPGLNLVESREHLWFTTFTKLSLFISVISVKYFWKVSVFQALMYQSFLIFFKIIMIRTPNMRSAFLNAQVQNIVLLTISTMLYSRCLELIHLTYLKLYWPLFTLCLPLLPAPGKYHSLILRIWLFY